MSRIIARRFEVQHSYDDTWLETQTRRVSRCCFPLWFQWAAIERRYTTGGGGLLKVEQVLAGATSVVCGCQLERAGISGSAAGDPFTRGDRTLSLSGPHSDIFILPRPLPSLVVFRNKAIWRPSSFCWCWCRCLRSHTMQVFSYTTKLHGLFSVYFYAKAIHSYKLVCAVEESNLCS